MSLNLSYLEEWTGNAFRNIATCDPSQYLFDDLVDGEDLDVLNYLDIAGIDSSKLQKDRVFQYGDISNSLACFKDIRWNISRFSDGTYGVWYGALDEETSKLETLYHRPEIDENDLKNATTSIIQDRRMFKASINGKRSLVLDTSAYSKKLIDKTNYGYCQQLGREAIRHSIDLFRTPSVRKQKGVCVPVFSKESILGDTFLYNYKNEFPINGGKPRVWISDSSLSKVK